MENFIRAVQTRSTRDFPQIDIYPYLTPKQSGCQEDGKVMINGEN
jgi:hypothetical protein